MFVRKIKINPTVFLHHRSGWKPVSEAMRNHLHTNQGVVFYDWADRVFKDNLVITHPWVGILHNVINYPTDEYPQKYTNRIYPLSKLVEQPHFKDSLKQCKGIFTLSEHTANYLRYFVDCEVHPLIHPVLPVQKHFNLDRYQNKIVTIGQWLRRYHSICELKTDHHKILVKTAGFDDDYVEMARYSSCRNVEMRKPMTNEQYDNLLASCVVFLDLYDVAACNVILECIIRNTPMLVNDLPAAIEYLGKDYPLYFQNLEDAASKLQLVQAAHEYLKTMDKTKFSLSNLLNSLTKSNIYTGLL